MVKVSGATNLLMAVTFRWVTDGESAHTGTSRPASGSVVARHDTDGTAPDGRRPRGCFGAGRVCVSGSEPGSGPERRRAVGVRAADERPGHD